MILLQALSMIRAIEKGNKMKVFTISSGAIFLNIIGYSLLAANTKIEIVVAIICIQSATFLISSGQ